MYKIIKQGRTWAIVTKREGMLVERDFFSFAAALDALYGYNN